MTRLRVGQFALLVFVAALLTSGLIGRAQKPASEPEDCTKADLEIHFGFYESPEAYFNFAVLGENVTDRACIFRDSLFDPRFTGDSRLFKCSDCAKREREGYRDDSAATFDPAVQPGEIVRKQYRWRTTPENDSISCIHPKGMDSEYSFTWALATPSLMTDVCSDISVVGTDVLAPRDQYQAEALWTNVRTTAEYKPLKLTAARTAYYIDEAFPLTVFHPLTPLTRPYSPACRPVFVWHRAVDGRVRVEEHSGNSSDGCQTVNFEFHPDKVFFTSEWKSAEARRLSNYGDQELQAFQKADAGGDPHLHFIASNVVHIQIEGAENPNLRNWTRVKGLAADILLDRDVYHLGEDIPLHLAIANFSAKAPVYSWDPVWDPCIAVGIKVIDDGGNALADDQRVRDPLFLCSGHGFGPKLFEQGRITSLEWGLKSTGWLPNRPGAYTIVLSWCTSTGTVRQSGGGWTADLKPYATVEAKALIHIVPLESPPLSR